ncbi:MAG TPA: hypothetical protein VIT45_11075 [Allosphingosinicella sp.]
MAIEHNDFVALTTNRQTVLNILRAREREPMHFTSFSNIAGKVQGSGQIGLNTAIGGDGGSIARTGTNAATTGATGVLTQTIDTNTAIDTLTRGATNWTPSAQVSVTTGTDFQIAVNASEEFYRGILGPLSPGIIVHYLRQGFPPDLLSHLVLRRLTFEARIIDSNDRPVATVPLGEFNNSPDDAEESTAFAGVMKCWRLGYEMQKSDSVRIPAPEIQELSGLNPDIVSRLRSVKGPNDVVRYEIEVKPGKSELALALEPIERPGCDTRDRFRRKVASWVGDRGLVGRGRSGSEQAGENGGPSLISSISAADRDSVSQGIGGSGTEKAIGRAPYLERELPPGYKIIVEIDMTIRSVEGVLYYLGEYARNPGSPRLYDPDACKGDPYCLPIIQVLPASRIPAGERLVDVTYRGRRYAVPLTGAELSPESGRSSQTISLVQQLLNLHRSSKDLPFTPLLRVQN